MQPTQQLPSYTERLSCRHSEKFRASWHVWVGSNTKKGMNRRCYLGDVNAIFTAARPASRREWERVWVQSMGKKLRAHARRFSAAMGDDFTVEEALTVIMCHAVDETWNGQQARKQACLWLNQQYGDDRTPEDVNEAVEAIANATEEHRGYALTEAEVTDLRRTEQELYDLRQGEYRRAEPWEVARWAVSVVEVRDGQVVTGFWVRGRSSLAQLGSTAPKEWERQKVQGFISYWERKQGRKPEVTFLSYDWDRSTETASGWQFVPARVALAEVAPQASQKDTKLSNRVLRRDIEVGGQYLRAVEPEELREREQQEQAKPQMRTPAEPEQPTLF